MPIMVSGLGYPGGGQMMQKRWAIGVVFALAFTACFVAFAVCVFRILAAYYAFLLDFAGYAPPEHLPIRQALLALAGALAVWAVSLADTYAGYRRDCAAWARRKLPRD